MKVEDYKKDVDMLLDKIKGVFQEYWDSSKISNTEKLLIIGRVAIYTATMRTIALEQLFKDIELAVETRKIENSVKLK